MGVGTSSTGPYGIGGTQIRLDGWVSAEFGYVFNVPDSQLPRLVTVPLDLPKCTIGKSLAVRVNVLTGVVGSVRIGIADAPQPKEFVEGLNQSTIIKGNCIDARASWCPNETDRVLSDERSERAFQQPVPVCQSPDWRLLGVARAVFHIVGNDASLFSIKLLCE